MKNIRVYLIILWALVFAASPVWATEVVEEWVARYNGPGNGADEAVAIAVDAIDNIYVTGSSWDSTTGYDYTTIKYDPNGSQLWLRRYNGPANSSDSAEAIALDAAGNIYVTGKSYGSGTSGDYATIKYDSAGGEQWVRRYNGPGNDYDEARAIAVDGSGNICVTGWSKGDCATIKYNSDSNELWCVRDFVGDAEYMVLAVDTVGNVYVANSFYAGYGAGRCETVKYTPDGNELWRNMIELQLMIVEIDFAEAYPPAIALDSSGNAYVSFSCYAEGPCPEPDPDPVIYDYQGVIVKYDPNGNPLWERNRQWYGTTAIAVDNAGDVYHAAGSRIIKYDPNGTELWSKDGVRDVAMDIDDAGNVYVTTCSYYGYDTVKYDPNGTVVWWAGYYGPVGNDYAVAIAVDGMGNVFVTGKSEGSGTDYDYATLKYSQYDVVLTMEASPPDINTVTPELGEHYYLSGTIVDISADRFVDCPDVYVFDYWDSDVNDPNSANTTVVMDTDKIVTAVFADDRECGDECHPYPEGDVNKDCKVNFFDIAVVANTWLECTDPNCD